jgi:hypothetical protein
MPSFNDWRMLPVRVVVVKTSGVRTIEGWQPRKVNAGDVHGVGPELKLPDANVTRDP